jgi:hypothetical protein
MGSTALVIGIMENKTVSNNDSQKYVIWHYVSPISAYGYNIWPEETFWGYVQPFYVSIPAYKNIIWP